MAKTAREAAKSLRDAAQQLRDSAAPIHAGAENFRLRTGDVRSQALARQEQARGDSLINSAKSMEEQAGMIEAALDPEEDAPEPTAA